jgi:hypothetical protein
LGRAPAHATAQLVQLREAKPFGMFDQHDGGVGHVHPHFHHRRRHQNVGVAVTKLAVMASSFSAEVIRPWSRPTLNSGKITSCRRWCSSIADRKSSFSDSSTNGSTM